MAIRQIDAMWMESDCPDCGHIFRWHRECKNLCPECCADYGFIVYMSEFKVLPPLEGSLWILEEKRNGKWWRIASLESIEHVTFAEAQTHWDGILNDDRRIRPGNARDLEEVREWIDWMTHIEDD